MGTEEASAKVMRATWVMLYANDDGGVPRRPSGLTKTMMIIAEVCAASG